MKRRTWYVVFALLVVCWVVTATWGRTDVTAFCKSQLSSLPYEWDHLEFDPQSEARPRAPQMPWYYIGRSTSPVPFIVAIDVAEMTAPLSGHRATYYVLWFFGLKYSIYQDIDWFS